MYFPTGEGILGPKIGYHNFGFCGSGLYLWTANELNELCFVSLPELKLVAKIKDRSTSV